MLAGQDCRVTVLKDDIRFATWIQSEVQVTECSFIDIDEYDGIRLSNLLKRD